MTIASSTVIKTEFGDFRVCFHEIGKDYVNYIDPHSVSANSAALQIKTYIEKSKLIQANFEVRSTYNLKNILKEKLLPLF